MSLVTRSGTIIIEDGDLSDASFGEGSNTHDEDLYRALRGVSATDDHITESSTDMERGDRYRRASASGRVGKHQIQGGTKKKQQPRLFNPKALERLNLPTAASRLRSQRKYKDQLREIKDQETLSPHKSISPVATRAGIRLYANALGKRKRLEHLREERERLLKQKEEKLTFKPMITSLAKLMGEGGYLPPHERYTRTSEKLAKKHLLQEKERTERITAGCTFHPTLASASEKLVNKQRKNEPFDDVGERLFFEGGRRLLRQQLRERILEQSLENRVVGAFQITQQAAKELSSRLLRWQEACDRNREDAQKAYLRSVTKPLVPPSKVHSGRDTRCCCSCHPSCSITKMRDIQLENELRRMHCRALFFKYTPSNKSSSLQLEDVKRQVRELFPEDSSIVDALMIDFRDGESISRSEFVESLLRFEHLHGPQPWGQPSCENVRTAFGNLFAQQLSLSKPPPFATPREGVKKATQTHKRASSVLAMHSPKKEVVGKMNRILPLTPPPSYRRSLSGIVYERLSRDPEIHSGRHGHHHGKEKVGENVPRKLCRHQSVELSARNNEKRFLDREKLDLCKHKQFLGKRCSSIHEIPPPQMSQERSQSLDSLEISSLTENCGSTSKMRCPEDIVSELEALIDTPTESSCTASPAQSGIRRTQEGVRDSNSSLPSALRRRGSHHPVVSKGAEGASYTESHNRRMTRERVVKEIEEILRERK